MTQGFIANDMAKAAEEEAHASKSRGMAQGFKEGDASRMAQGFVNNAKAREMAQGFREADEDSLFDKEWSGLMAEDEANNRYDIALKGDASIFDEENFGDMPWGGTEGTWSEEDKKEIDTS